MRVAATESDDSRRKDRKIDHGARLHRTRTGIDDQLQRMLVARSNSFGIVEGLDGARGYQCRRNERLAQLGQQCLHDSMVGDPHAYRAALRVFEPAWNFTTSRQEKCVTAGHALLDDAKLPVVENRVTSDFGEIAAHQGQMMLVVDAAQCANALRRGDIAHTASQRVTRVGGIRDHAACTQNRGRLPQESGLRISRMDRKILRHWDSARATRPSARRSMPFSLYNSPQC